MQGNTFIGQLNEFIRYGAMAKETIKLDLLDKKILHLLGTQARLSCTSLAKALRLKRETILYRIKRMKEKNFLHGTITLLDPRQLGLKNYLVYLKLKTVAKEAEFLNYLESFPVVTRLKNCSGTYDVQLVFTVRQEEEFLSHFESITSAFHDIIHSYEVLQIVEEDFLGLGLLLPAREVPHQAGEPKMEEQMAERGAKGRDATEQSVVERQVKWCGAIEQDAMEWKVVRQKGSTFHKEFLKAQKHLEQPLLDEKDVSLLEALRLQGDVSISDLSRHLSLSPLAVENRIRKLILSGVIKRFFPLASLHQLGYQWWKVFLRFRDLNHAKFLTFIHLHPHILWYMRLLGKWDYQISIFARDNAEFHKVVDELRKEFEENIVNYDSIIVFNQFKFVQRVE